MIQQSTRTKVLDKLLASLHGARAGSRDLDIIVSFVLGDTSSDAGKMIQLLVEEGYPWDVISELLDEDLPPYTTSVDAALKGENIVLSAYSRKRGRWAAAQRAKNGRQILAWAATECLARRLAALKALRADPGRPRGAHPPATASPTPPARPAQAATAEAEEGAEEEWKILF